MIKLPEILPAPERPSHLPLTAKWLSGEGAGSWFVIRKNEEEQDYRITRFSPSGVIECDGFFNSVEEIDLTLEYAITYPSNCLKVTLTQRNKKIRFHKTKHDSWD